MIVDLIGAVISVASVSAFLALRTTAPEFWVLRRLHVVLTQGLSIGREKRGLAGLSMHEQCVFVYMHV